MPLSHRGQKRFILYSELGSSFHLGVNCGESKGVEPGIFCLLLYTSVEICLLFLLIFLAHVWWQFRQCTSHKLTKSRQYALLPNRFSGCKRKAIELEGMSGNKGLAKTTAMTKEIIKNSKSHYRSIEVIFGHVCNRSNVSLHAMLA